MTIFFIVDILVCIFGAAMTFMLFNAYLEKREELSKYVYILGIIVLSSMYFASNRLFNLMIFNAIGMIVSAFLVSLLFSTKLSVRIIISMLSYLLFAIIEIIVLFSMTSIMQKTVTEIVSNVELRLLGIIISKAFTFFVVKIACMKKTTVKFSVSHWLLFCVIFLSSALAMFLMFSFQYEEIIAYSHNLIIICSVGLLLGTFFTLYLYEHMAKQAETINRQKIFEQQVKEQARYLDEILLSQEHLKTFRHDIKNHLTALTSYFETNKNKEGLNYLLSIENMANLKNSAIETGNTALDAIINSKKALAESKGIVFTTKIGIPELLPIEPTDVCIIFGNALDNAIEACEKIELDNKSISVAVIYENNSITCKIANTFNLQNSNLKTTKKDKRNHGFGIGNIKIALDKYKHIFKTEQTEDEFVLSFIIFI